MRLARCRFSTPQKTRGVGKGWHVLSPRDRRNVRLDQDSNIDSLFGSVTPPKSCAKEVRGSPHLPGQCFAILAAYPSSGPLLCSESMVIGNDVYQ